MPEKQPHSFPDSSKEPGQVNPSIHTDFANPDHEPESSAHSGSKKPSRSSNIGVWIVAALCVLAITIAITFYAQNPKRAAQAVESRSMTLVDVGFDTPITFQTTSSEEDFNRYLDIVRSTFIECNTLFDAVKDHEGALSLYALNQQAHDRPVEVDEKILDLTKDSLQIYTISNKFDPSQGKLTALWRDALNKAQEQADLTGTLPSQEEIDQTINPSSMNAVKIEGDTIELTDEQADLDFGGIAKGYTAGLAAERLKEAGMEYGLINAGGNVVLIGEKPDGSNWRVGIQDPAKNDSVVIYSSKAPTCLVTSGDYQRYMMVDGKRYAHVIDPTTGYPAENMRSVTVINEDSAYCDGMSTALFCMSVSDGLDLCRSLDLDAIWITDKGSVDLEPDFSNDRFDVYVTEGIRDQVHLKE